MRVCIFCGGPANSKEHAWPDWLLSHLSGSGTSWIRSEREGEPTRSWHGIGAGVKVKYVCVRCNTGWMSALEVEAKPTLLPLVHGQATELSAKQELIVATWSLKTVIAFDYTRAGHKIFFSQDERDRLYTVRAKKGLGLPFPPNTFMWLAAYDGDAAATCSASALSGLGGLTSDREVKIEGHVATISAGAFVVQILIMRLPNDQLSSNPPADWSKRAWDRATVRIWPLGGGPHVTWPPQQHLNDAALDDFAYRWPRYSLAREQTTPLAVSARPVETAEKAGGSGAQVGRRRRKGKR